MFGIRFSDKEYFLERLARRRPVLDKWAEERVRAQSPEVECPWEKKGND
jgi:hypothetical protein